MSDQDVLFNIEDSSSSGQENIDLEQNPGGPNLLTENNLDFIDLDDLTEFPWRKPGADITDYFNYGFDENSWRVYSKRQKDGKWEKRRNEKRDTRDNRERNEYQRDDQYRERNDSDQRRNSRDRDYWNRDTRDYKTRDHQRDNQERDYWDRNN